MIEAYEDAFMLHCCSVVILFTTLKADLNMNLVCLPCAAVLSGERERGCGEGGTFTCDSVFTIALVLLYLL